MKSRYLYLFTSATLFLFVFGCADEEKFNSKEVITFENVNASSHDNLELQDQESDKFISDSFINYYGFAYPYYNMPYIAEAVPYVDPFAYPLVPYSYGFADYYTTPIAVELPALAGFPIYRYEHPFYAPYIYESLYFDDDNGLYEDDFGDDN